MSEFDESKREDFLEAAQDVGNTVARKNIQYGDSFSKTGSILKILYPTGIRVDQYDDVLTVARVIDKLFRIATKARDDEEDPWFDICGYSLLEVNKRMDHDPKEVEEEIDVFDEQQHESAIDRFLKEEESRFDDTFHTNT